MRLLAGGRLARLVHPIGASAVLGLVIAFASVQVPVSANAGKSAADATSTVTETATATVPPTVEQPAPASPTPSSTSTPTATPPPQTRVKPEAGPTSPPKKRSHRRRKASRIRKATPTPTPKAESRRRRKQVRRKPRATPTPRPTPTPTPTPTPAVSLSTDDSIKPVTCNGSGKPIAAHPFLSPPFAAWTTMGSYFDHDSPNFFQDGLVITTTGLEARPDDVHRAWDFPAYWSPALRQYVYYDGHNGYDFNLWYEPVYAAAAGKVIFAGWEYPDAHDHGYGDMVMIDHHNGYVTLYGHFSKLRVKAGQRVKRLQLLGISGNSGHSSGPHLHFTVFHNCSPTDPYGWTGSGPDPLEGYQNESSIYLWLRAPLVINPLPHMAGLSDLPATAVPRLLLLKLPSTARGTRAFSLSLVREAQAARAAFGIHGARLDLLHGALDITSAVSPGRLYTLPFVASIASMDVAPDAKADVLSALGRAALIDRTRGLPLGRTRGWTGSLLQWQGRAILVGRGPKAKRAALRLTRPRGGTIVQKLQADPKTGSYAVDLGRMSRREVALLDTQLQGKPKHSPIPARPPERAAVVKQVHNRAVSGSSVGTSIAFAGLAVFGIAAVLMGSLWYRRRRNER